MDISGTDKTCHVPGQKPRAKVLGKPAKPFGGKSVVGRGEPGVGSYGLIGGGGGSDGSVVGTQVLSPRTCAVLKVKITIHCPWKHSPVPFWSSTFRCPTKTKLKSLGFKIS